MLYVAIGKQAMAAMIDAHPGRELQKITFFAAWHPQLPRCHVPPWCCAAVAHLLCGGCALAIGLLNLRNNLGHPITSLPLGDGLLFVVFTVGDGLLSGLPHYGIGT